MTSRDSMQKLQELRAQLQQLEQQHPGTLEAATDTAPNADTHLDGLQDWLAQLQDVEGEELLRRIREEAGQWLGELDADLKEIEPATIFALFGLGVLVGRLTK